MFAAPRQSYDMYDTILGPSIDKDCLYVGFIGVGAIWQNLRQDENSESQASPGGYLYLVLNLMFIQGPFHSDVK